LFEVVGNADKFAPEHMSETCVNVGVIESVTDMVVVSEQPRLFMYVIKDFPNAFALTKPVLDIVATAVLSEFHGFVVAAVPDPVN
jgi:hypothetical protein